MLFCQVSQSQDLLMPSHNKSLTSLNRILLLHIGCHVTLEENKQKIPWDNKPGPGKSMHQADIMWPVVIERLQCNKLSRLGFANQIEQSDSNLDPDILVR